LESVLTVVLGTAGTVLRSLAFAEGALSQVGIPEIAQDALGGSFHEMLISLLKIARDLRNLEKPRT